MGLRGRCEQRAAYQCKGHECKIRLLCASSGSRLSAGGREVTPPRPLVPARSTPFLCQIPRSSYEDLPCLPVGCRICRQISLAALFRGATRQKHDIGKKQGAYLRQHAIDMPLLNPELKHRGLLTPIVTHYKMLSLYRLCHHLERSWPSSTH